MKPTPLISESFLESYLQDFRLASVAGIRDINSDIDDLIKELESGKIDSAKEEEIKPRFINAFFGDILGFNYGNSNNWQLRDEKKTMLSGKKTDSALGFFSIKKEEDDVRAVIEIKDSKTELDAPQNNRHNKDTPIQQAFAYAPGMGGNCKWVIVSNIKETRFYSSNDNSKYQVFYLKDLQQERKLKELLYLFHKDRFIHLQGPSRTDQLLEKSKKTINQKQLRLHIIDKIYYSLKRFYGFGFVDPNFIATIYPFNIQNDYVWQYDRQTLFTINGDLFNLLQQINVENGHVIFTSQLQEEVKNFNIVDAEFKLEQSFKFLNRCLINKITAIKDYKAIEEKNKEVIGFSIRNSFSFKNEEEGITKNVIVKEEKSCDCLICNYRNLDFKRFLKKLKISEGDPDCYTREYAYAHYLVATNNFKTPYIIYKHIEKEIKGKEGKAIEYFLTKQNIKLLHNLALNYGYDDGKEIMADIKSIDLDKVIYDEIEFEVEREVKDYLIDVKEDVLIYRLQDEIEKILFEIDETKILYENGGTRSGADLGAMLFNQYLLLFAHINQNFIIYNVFSRYKALATKFFRGIVTVYQIPGLYNISFNEFVLTEAILNIPSDSLQKILEKVGELKTENGCNEKLLNKLINFTTATFDDTFGHLTEDTLLNEQLKNHTFEHQFTSIFANLFTVFSHLNISKEQFQKCVKPLVKFLTVEKVVAWYDLKELSNFIYKKGDLFEANELLDVLTIAIKNHKYGYVKYPKLIKTISRTLAKIYPDYKISNTKLIQISILNSSSDTGNGSDFKHLIYLANACDESCKKLLYIAFENYLDTKFQPSFYEILIRNSDYDYNLKNYFKLYTEATINTRSNAYKYGKLKLTDLILINYIIVVYRLQIPFDKEDLKCFSQLNNFETWLLNPFTFDYTNFDAKWLIDANIPDILNRIKGNGDIKLKVEKELKQKFDPILAEILYGYFN